MKTAPQKNSTVEKTCNKCHEQWPADTEFFYREPSNRDGLRLECIACKASYDSCRKAGRFSKRNGSLTQELQSVFTKLINKHEPAAHAVQRIQ